MTSESFSVIQGNGSTLNLSDLTALSIPTQLWEVEKISICPSGHTAWSVFWIAKDSCLSEMIKTTAILEKVGDVWKVVHAHSSVVVSLEQAKFSLAATRQ